MRLTSGAPDGYPKQEAIMRLDEAVERFVDFIHII